MSQCKAGFVQITDMSYLSGMIHYLPPTCWQRGRWESVREGSKEYFTLPGGACVMLKALLQEQGQVDLSSLQIMLIDPKIEQFRVTLLFTQHFAERNNPEIVAGDSYLHLKLFTQFSCAILYVICVKRKLITVCFYYDSYLKVHSMMKIKNAECYLKLSNYYQGRRKTFKNGIPVL